MEGQFTPDDMRYFLEKYREDVRDYENSFRRLEMINLQLEGIGAQKLTGMPRNPSPEMDKYVEPLSRKFEIMEYIEARKELLENERKLINGLVDGLESADERQMIRLRYLDGIEWSDILFEMYGDRGDYQLKEDSLRRNARRVQQRAIWHMTERANSG